MHGIDDGRPIKITSKDHEMWWTDIEAHNVVEGDGVLIETAGAPPHPLSYAKTLLVPAAVGHYGLRSRGSGRVRGIKALVR